MSGVPEAVVCIPTFRRPGGLKRTLESIAALARSGSIRVHGYVLLCLLEAFTYLLVSAGVSLRHPPSSQ